MEVSNKIVMKKITEIKPYIRNPRKNDDTVAKLVELIPQVGFNVPIVIDKNGVIVKGHARYKAAIKLGMEEVPCIVHTGDEEAIKLDRIADNRVSEFSEWLSEGLNSELDSINLDLSSLEFDMSFKDDDLGFDFDKGESDADRQARFAAMLAEEEKKSADKTQITTPAAIEKAVEKQQEEKEHKPQEYYKCICSKCGNIMFFSKDEVLKW